MADGEDNERVWSKTRHQTIAGRICAYDTRIAALTAQFVAIGREIDLDFPSIFPKKLKSVVQRLHETEKNLNTLCHQTSLTMADLEVQAKSMKEFYSTTTFTKAQLEDDICGHLLVIEDVKKYFAAREAVRKVVGYQWTDINFQISRRTNTNGRIKFPQSDNELIALEKKVEDMLKRAQQTLSDWIGPDGERTSLYLEREARLHLYQLRRRKEEIWRLLVARRIEMHNLHSFAQGLTPNFTANHYQARELHNPGSQQ